jgi:hypothetical protein
VAFPSRRKTQESVHSKEAPTIFFVVGFINKIICDCEDSTLAYFFMLTAAEANCRFLPALDTFNDKTEIIVKKHEIYE